jgi:hypothetical protein
MGVTPDESGLPELRRQAARALNTPDAADLHVLTALARALHAVPSGASAGLPWQRPPQHGEDGLATRHPL